MVLPIPHARRQEPYEYNGYISPGNSGFIAGKPSQPKKKKDIGEKNINEGVHGFVSHNNMVEPTPYARRQSAYEYNGG
jgi:hypothetical protein